MHPNPALALLDPPPETETSIEVPKFEPKEGTKPGTREWMQELTAYRKEVGKLDPSKKGGRARTKITRAEAEERALAKMVPKALKVLELQLESEDERVQQAAAREVLDRARGKAAQTIKQTGDQVHRVVYESAPWTFGRVEEDDAA